MKNRLFYHNSTIFLQDSLRKICGMHNFIKLTEMVLYLYSVGNVCNKNVRIYIYKQIRFSVIVSVEYKIKINLRSFKSSEHIFEEGDGPYRGFGYSSLVSGPLDLATWSQRELQ